MPRHVSLSRRSKQKVSRFVVPSDLFAFQYRLQPDADRHRDVLQDDDGRGGALAAADRQRFRHRSGNERRNCASALAAHTVTILGGIVLLSRSGITIWRARKWVSPERP
jgi:hypothetical protein